MAGSSRVFGKNSADPVQSRRSPQRTLVMGDLARIWFHFSACDQSTWVASVRRARPYFLAFLRTNDDRRSAPLIDDLMRSCDQRLLVCGDLAETEQLEACIHEALVALDPESLTDVRYSSATDAFWIQFGDGLGGSTSLADLGIKDLRDELVLESGIPGDRGSTMIVTRTDGSPFEIDSASLRSVLDSEFRQQLRDTAHASNATVGARVRSARKAAGITQRELGRRAGLDQAVISNLETGKHDPRAETLRRLARALDLSLARTPSRLWLTGNQGSSPPSPEPCDERTHRHVPASLPPLVAAPAAAMTIPFASNLHFRWKQVQFGKRALRSLHRLPRCHGRTQAQPGLGPGDSRLCHQDQQDLPGTEDRRRMDVPESSSAVAVARLNSGGLGWPQRVSVDRTNGRRACQAAAPPPPPPNGR